MWSGGGESLIRMGSGENRRGNGIRKYRQFCREVSLIGKLTTGALAVRDIQSMDDFFPNGSYCNMSDTNENDSLVRKHC